MVMIHSLSQTFTSADLRLKNDPDTYQVNTRVRNPVKDHVVMFVDHFQRNPPIEPPSAHLLAIHAAFARVFYASGASEYVDDI
jgi:hypothetical protein